MSKKVLDYEGLATLVSKLKDTFPLKTDTATKNYVTSLIGALSSLTTTDKTNIVNAINELVANGIKITTWDTGFDVKESVTGIYQLGSGCKNLSWAGWGGQSSSSGYPGVTVIKININSGNNFAIYFQTPGSQYHGLARWKIFIWGMVSGGRVQYSVDLVSDGAQYFSGTKTFAALPQVNSNNIPTPTQNYQLVPKKYVDEAVAGVDLSNYLAKDNEDEFVPEGDYNPSTKKYVDDKFFRGNDLEWEALTDEEKASYAIAVVSPGYVELTEGDIGNLQTAVGEEIGIDSDMLLEDALEAALNIAGESEE